MSPSSSPSKSMSSSNLQNLLTVLILSLTISQAASVPVEARGLKCAKGQVSIFSPTAAGGKVCGEEWGRLMHTDLSSADNILPGGIVNSGFNEIGCLKYCDGKALSDAKEYKNYGGFSFGGAGKTDCNCLTPVKSFQTGRGLVYDPSSYTGVVSFRGLCKDSVGSNPKAGTGTCVNGHFDPNLQVYYGDDGKHF